MPVPAAHPFAATALLLAAACATQASPPAPTDRELLEDHDFWYGVYVDGRKVGFACSQSAVVERAGERIFQRHSRFEMHTAAAGRDQLVVTVGAEEYSADPPFPLLFLYQRREQQGEMSAVTAERDGAVLQVRQSDGPHEQLRVMECADYGLRDLMAERQWLRTDPAAGASLRIRSLDLDRLALGWTTTTLQEKGVEGDRRWFLVERTGASDGTVERDRVGVDGGSLRWELGSYELRRETAASARRDLAILDVDRRGRVRVAAPLGDPRAILGLTALVTGAPPDAFVDAPGQRVRVEAGGLVIDTGPELTLTATARELRDDAGETLRLPSRDPAIAALARTAAGDAVGARARVCTLCAFVADYLVDDEVVCDHPTVPLIIAARRGDCSDHARLFAALARALGIPARPVSGLVYGGDAEQEFVPHDWCEVVIDGQWIAVDPTWNEVPANGTHLRISPSMAASPAPEGLAIEVLNRR